ncbi:hypothetical protein Rsub_09737 [Raphidocelis subcapitata]|uniref:Tyrosine-protein kinase ephrin type A/B receptor-like domain-containing protein n=1 Tax=Raphidocelis subcapitata TaxID=307507 RepID=A0A2V0PDT4_9CHLO|nr:hypothetical protein Rsub_09737 [Raphidocelis subcapitata]|eukprot:GBF97679.1 hypothetical protein Rsub_09737 [Raphidocelis subcapitata]
MMSLLTLLVLTAPLFATPAYALGRALRQAAPTDECTAAVAGCAFCRFSAPGVSPRVTVCVSCTTGFALKQNGTACWCAPGYRAVFPAQCLPCGEGYHCPGATTTAASARARYKCGAHKHTATATARSEAECVADQGYAWAPGDASTQCDVASWSRGGGTSGCTPCRAGLTTLAKGATSPADCLAGVGLELAGGRVTPCRPGFFKSTIANTACTRCPPGWTTALGATGSTERKACDHAVPGFAIAPGAVPGTPAAAAPCGYDSFSTARARYDPAVGVKCQACPSGARTKGTGAGSSAACLAPPGHGWGVGAATARPAAAPLEAAAPAPLDQPVVLEAAAPAAVEQQAQEQQLAAAALDLGVVTLAAAEQEQPPAAEAAPADPTPVALLSVADAAAASMAPPMDLAAAAAGTAAAAAVVECPVGTYNEGWNNEPCRACDAAGGSITTGGPGAFSPDRCYTPPGHGTARTADGGLTGAPCPADTFGIDGNTWGLVDAPCSACLDHTGTRGATGVTTGDACVTDPGYGYAPGGAFQCDFGSWAAGGDRSACTSCGARYNTTDGQRAIRGADGPDHCAPAAGWTPDGAGGLKPCPRGAYKEALGPAPCSACPSGTTTTGVSAAASLSQCDACRPGFGLPPGTARIDAKAPACALCASGSFSLGGVAGGAACAPCPKPGGYSGNMVSRRGASGPEGCLPEFSGNGADDSALPYDRIVMADAALTRAPEAGTVEACQAACAARPGCQYFEFRSADGSGCRLRDFGAPLAGPVPNVDDPSRSYALFEVSDQRYAAYEAHPTDAASLGQPLGSYAKRSEALNACGTDGACVGIKFVAGAPDGKPWRTFRGTLRSRSTSSQHVNQAFVGAFCQQQPREIHTEAELW